MVGLLDNLVRTIDPKSRPRQVTVFINICIHDYAFMNIKTAGSIATQFNKSIHDFYHHKKWKTTLL